MDIKLLLNETYKHIKINNQNLFLKPFDTFLSDLFSNNLDYLLNDDFVIKYIYENINLLFNINDSYKIILLKNTKFIKILKSYELVNLISSLTNDNDKTNILLNENISKKIFTNHYLVFSSLDLKYKNIKNYTLLLNNLDYKQKIIVLKSINDEDYVANILKNIDFRNQTELMYILRRFKKDENKKLFLDKLNDHYKSEIIISMNDKNYIYSKFDTLVSFYKLDFLKKEPDEVKIKYIEKNYFKEELIASLSKMELIFKYFLKTNDYAKQKKIIENVRNDEIKFALFELMTNLNDKYFEMILYLLQTVEDKKIKEKLTNLLNNDGINKVIESNKKDLSKEIDKEKLVFKNYVDSNITIGVEIEASHKYNNSYILIGHLLNKWVIKDEGTVQSGVEINSRILNYNEHDLKELKYVCNFLKENGFKTTSDCGGHIHLGFNYFKTIYELQMFYYLFIHSEEILYVIFNKENEMERALAKTNASSIKGTMLSYFGPYMEAKTNDLDTLAVLIGKAQKDRYKSLNILNCHSIDKKTIELRIPNGTLDFDEINLNIILFARLMEKGKYFANNPKKEYLKDLFSLSKDIPIEEKKDILLDLLFENDLELKNKYYDRFEANIKLYKDSQNVLKR